MNATQIFYAFLGWLAGTTLGVGLAVLVDGGAVASFGFGFVCATMGILVGMAAVR